MGNPLEFEFIYFEQFIKNEARKIQQFQLWVKCMMLLYENEGYKSLVALSRDLKTNSSYLSKLLDVMQSNGLVKKRASIVDSRKYSIELTMDGKMMARNIQPLYNMIIGRKGRSELWI
jgi:DNA-binding MarR family transcriptional regulator